jgi:Arabinose efflux permease
MNDPAAASARPDAYAALRLPEFRSLLAGVFLFTIGLLVQEVVIGYQLYRVTHDPLVLGLVGLAEAVPFISLALFGGHIADRHDKRAIMLLAMGCFIVGSGILLWDFSAQAHHLLSQTPRLLIIYAVIALLGLARGFFSPAAGSLKALLVPRELYSNSSAWSSTAWQGGAIVGPAAGGFLYAGIGLEGALWTVVGLLAVATLLFARIRSRPPIPDPDGDEDSIWESLREGIAFVRGTPLILYSISLDLFSVLFGGVVAILPVFATDILHVGAEGLGVLRAAPSLGAMLTLFACAHYPPTVKAWRNLLLAVTGFGLATLVFALSQNIWLSIVALFATGVFDAVSVVIRQTVLQIMPPDHLRGRVVAVNSIFVSSSNELGAFESGVAARLMGTVLSVVVGGSATLLTALYVWRRSRALFSLRLL